MPALPAVHPLQPRFAQAITGVLCLEAVLFDTPAAVVVALALVLLNLLAPRWSPVAWTFRRIARPSGDLEPVAPVRFAQGLAAGFLILALVLLGVGAGLAGWILVWPRGRDRPVLGDLRDLRGVRGLPAAPGPPRRGRAADVRDDLGLTGAGPWLVVLTAPGCARCEPVARELEAVAGDREVHRVSLAEHPRAAVAARAQRARGAGRVGATGACGRRAPAASSAPRSAGGPGSPLTAAPGEAPIARRRRGSILVRLPRRPAA